MTDTMHAAAQTNMVVINGTTFWISKILPEQAAPIFFDLQKTYLPFAIEALDVVSLIKDKKNPNAEALSVEAMTSVISKLSQQLSGAEFTALYKKLILPNTISFQAEGGQPIALTDAMNAMAFKHWFDQVELLTEVLKWNFTDFLPRFMHLFGKAKEVAMSLTPQ